MALTDDLKDYIARNGEVVIIEDSVAARVTHVLSPSGEAVS